MVLYRVVYRVIIWSPSVLYTQDLNRGWQPIFSLYLCPPGPSACNGPATLCNFCMPMLKNTVLWTAFRFYSQKLEKTTRKSSILQQKFGRFRNFPFSPTGQNGPKMRIAYSSEALQCHSLYHSGLTITYQSNRLDLNK